MQEFGCKIINVYLFEIQSEAVWRDLISERGLVSLSVFHSLDFRASAPIIPSSSEMRDSGVPCRKQCYSLTMQREP